MPKELSNSKWFVEIFYEKLLHAFLKFFRNSLKNLNGKFRVPVTLPSNKEYNSMKNALKYCTAV